jgi:hypothetical protein
MRIFFTPVSNLLELAIVVLWISSIFVMDVGRDSNGSGIHPKRKWRIWVTVGSVQNPGMALRREFQAQWVVKHLKVVSRSSGFNVPT